jgi:hypothetical protein
MDKIILDPALREKLNGLGREFELCDETGRTLGHYLPDALYRKLVLVSEAGACFAQSSRYGRGDRAGPSPKRDGLYACRVLEADGAHVNYGVEWVLIAQNGTVRPALNFSPLPRV